MISGREARRRLCDAGSTDRQARDVLASGLAGVPHTTGSRHLYDEHRVRALTCRPVLGRPDLLAGCPRGWVVARRPSAALQPSPAARMRALQDGWPESAIWTWTFLAVLLSEGPLPFIATVSGFVYLGADLVGCRGGRLVLRDAGPWFDRFRDTRLPLGRGRPLHVELAPRRRGPGALAGPPTGPRPGPEPRLDASQP